MPISPPDRFWHRPPFEPPSTGTTPPSRTLGEERGARRHHGLRMVRARAMRAYLDLRASLAWFDLRDRHCPKGVHLWQKGNFENETPL